MYVINPLMTDADVALKMDLNAKFRRFMQTSHLSQRVFAISISFTPVCGTKSLPWVQMCQMMI